MVSATGKADPQRRGLFVSGDAHHAGETLHDLVVGWIVFQRSIFAEAGDRAVDQISFGFSQRLVTQSQPVHDARPKIFDDHVRRRHQPAEDFFSRGIFQIDGHGTFAGVLSEEGRAHQAPVQLRISAQLAGEIAGAGNLDFDHVRA